ncbi:hypothetical protein BP5796_04680 [Coleophoma crateriformis]|uniref:Uncharacterized protein n=1 Tax=Coleophoma crateriformis TaxID=565419 RepID=A0A3D8SA05_9HELO|nr:hypothetical protein BP5796_04680 [Coleophoma crateriformis]
MSAGPIAQSKTAVVSLLETIATIPTERLRLKQLLYTWKNCFASRIKDVRPTDLIYHAIELIPGATPFCDTAPRYNNKDKAFADQVFPETEEEEVIIGGFIAWGRRLYFPKKGSDLLRVVHKFIPVNVSTIKPVYPMHNLEDVLDMVTPGISIYITADATNVY